MKQNQQSKEYKTPTFQLVKQDEQSKAFFAASGPAVPSVGGINTMVRGNATEW